MNLQEYKEGGQLLYGRFADTINNILILAIETSNKNRPYSYRLQQIQSRPKSVRSIEKKLNQKELTESTDIAEALNDLAGCRVVFYYNNDVNAFLHSRIVEDNFFIQKTKRHHLQGEDVPVKDNYRADHYVIELNPER